MPIRFTSEPPNGLQLAKSALDQLVSQYPIFFRSVRVENPQALWIKQADNMYAPHPHYILGAKEILDGQGLAAARLWGFYYIIEEGGQPKARAHVLTDKSGSALKSHVSFGLYAQDAVLALDELFNHPRLREKSYELRVLDCPDLYFMAFWLKPDSGEEDLIYPLAHSPDPLKEVAETLYKAEEFLTALQDVAGDRIIASQAMDDGLNPHTP